MSAVRGRWQVPDRLAGQLDCPWVRATQSADGHNCPFRHRPSPIRFPLPVTRLESARGIRD